MYSNPMYETLRLLLCLHFFLGYMIKVLYFLTLYIQDFGCRKRLILSTDGTSFTSDFSRQHQNVCLEIPCVFLCSVLFRLVCKLKNRSGDFSGNSSYYQNLHQRHDDFFPSIVILENTSALYLFLSWNTSDI
jgi:hypothetical protein